MTRRLCVLGAGCLAGLCLGAGLTLAQQGSSPEAGGPVLTFGIRSTLSFTDNYNLAPSDGDSVWLFDNRLSFGYRNRRPTDVLRLDLSGILRANDPPGGSRTFDDQTARLGYDRRGVNSALSLGADYSLASVNSIDPFDRSRFLDEDPFADPDLPVDPDLPEDPIEETDLTRDQGDREEITTRLRFETGLSAPLGLVLEGRYRERSFSGTTDTGLFDRQILDLSGTTRITLSPVTQMRLVLRYEDYSADDAPQTDRQTGSVNLGLNQALSQVDTLDVSLGFQQIETDQTVSGLRRSGTESGAVGSLALTRVLPRGTIGTTFELRQSVNGTTATWMVNRALPLPRGSLGVSLGATRDVADDILPVARLNFSHATATSTFTAALSQQVRTSSQSNELRTTRASLGYRYQINSVSSLGLSANFVELAESGGPAVNDTTRTDLRATYSHSLTRDWQLSSGYEYRMRDEDTRGSATSNRVFLALERSFVLRP